MAVKNPENILLIVRFFSEFSEKMPEMTEKLSELLTEDFSGLIPGSVALNIPADPETLAVSEKAGFHILPSGKKGLPLLNLPAGDIDAEIDVPGSYIMPAAADCYNTTLLNKLTEKKLSLLCIKKIGNKPVLTLTDAEKEISIPALIVNAAAESGKLTTVLSELKNTGSTAALIFDYYPGNDEKFLEFLNLLKLKFLRKNRINFIAPEALRQISTEAFSKISALPCAGPASTPLFRSRMIPENSLSSVASAAGTRTLVANMSGQTQLAGEKINLHFYRGRPTGVSCSKLSILNWTGGGASIKTSEGVLKYTNESAFSFEDEEEYGMRTLQYPEKLSQDSRIITDFYFSDNFDDPLISIFADYPELPDDSVVYEASLCEIPLFDLRRGEIKIEYSSSDGSSGSAEPGRGIGKWLIPGNRFTLRSGKRLVEISYYSDTNGINPGLPVKIAGHRGRRYFFVNPGGNYYPVPAWFYSGRRDHIQFSFKAVEI